MVKDSTATQAMTATNLFRTSSSSPASDGLGNFQYPAGEPPYKGCDNNVNTKTLNFDPCGKNLNTGGSRCGLETGMYVTTKRNASLAVGAQLCTGADIPSRDPTGLSSTKEQADLATIPEEVIVALWSCFQTPRRLKAIEC